MAKPGFLVCILLTTSLLSPALSAAESSQWDSEEQPWAQYGRNPEHDFTPPDHNTESMSTIESPIINWQAFDGADDVDSYSSVIGNFSQSITRPDAALERCGFHSLFAVMTRTVGDSDTGDRHLSIIDGDSAKVAWDVNLGSALRIRATPIIIDVDGDGMNEIIVVYDTDSALNVDVWSPRLTCEESGWVSNDNVNQKLWTWTDNDLRLSAPSPHLPVSQVGHRAYTQPLLADLSMDGSPELVLAGVNQNTDYPTVVAIPLVLQGPPETNWEVTLDRGTHPSDPSFAALDDSTGCVVLTTINANSGSMWLWKIDGSSGSLDWDSVSISGTDSDNDAPRLKLPGPVVTQLDSDAAPEMIVTLPSDTNGRDNGYGAQFVGFELTSTDEIFRFRAQNGYADAMPTPVDTDEDGITDRLCWVTWYSTSSVSFNREGMVGCHDLTLDPPLKEWVKVMNRGNSGNDNDEIAASPVIVLDLDGQDPHEVIVGFGRRVFAFDGNSGAPADINSAWSSPIDTNHRMWSAPAVADLDGDGYLDILWGDTLISESLPDLAPLADGRGIGFSPVDPDPGEELTVSGLFSNIGTISTEDPVDAVLLRNGQEIARHRVEIAEPVSPSGEGGPVTFSVEITAELGEHTFSLVLDPNQNITQTRYDNDQVSVNLSVVEPFVSQISTPSEVTRVQPGQTEPIEIQLTSTGSRTGTWTLSADDSNLDEDWTFSLMQGYSYQQTLERDTPVSLVFEAGVPNDALGGESGIVTLTLTLDDDPSIYATVALPIEVFRTRGLAMEGPSGLSISEGGGRLNHDAKAWVRIENLGNAPESTSSIDFSASSWGTSPRLVDQQGSEVVDLELQPGESVEMYITLQVAKVTSTTFDLTICIGYGDEQICEIQIIVMHAWEVSSPQPHIRTIPATTLSWPLEVDLQGNDNITWTLTGSGMVNEGWVWTFGGDFSIDGQTIVASGTSLATGWINLSLPENTPPNRHFFNLSANNLETHNLNISLHVLQVFRSQAAVVSPTSPATLNVSEATKIILKLENPGNGEDTFTLTGQSLAGNLSSAPNVAFDIPEPTKTLSAGAYTFMPIWVTLASEIPARENFPLQFTWTSVNDEDASYVANLTVQARPDHRWELDIAEGYDFEVIPGETLSFALTAKNIGNAEDNITIISQFEHERNIEDLSSWDEFTIQTTALQVNQSQILEFQIQVPSTSWAFGKTYLNLSVYSDSLLLEEKISLTFDISEIAGWRFNLSNASLEVPPEGGNITLIVEQRGNSPSSPWFTKAGEGWNVTLPKNGTVVKPGEQTLVTFFATPPERSLAGEIGVVRIRISNGDGAGQVVEEVPLRVGTAPKIEIGNAGYWYVNENGGMPTAWIHNQGNDIAVLEIQLSASPDGWTTSGSASLVLSPGEIKGIPIELFANTDWDKSGFGMTISITHPLLGTTDWPIQIRHANVTFASSPVISGYQTSVKSIELHNPNSISASVEKGTLSGNSWMITLDNLRENISLTAGDDLLTLHADGRNIPAHSAQCTLLSPDTEKLGLEAISENWVSCFIEASEDSEAQINLILRSSRGELLQQSTIELLAGKNRTVNLSFVNWDPAPGSVDVIYEVSDSLGIQLSSGQTTLMSRESGWNIGVATFSIDSESITVGISRLNQGLIQSGICSLIIEEVDGAWEYTAYVDISGSTYAPIIRIDRPESITEGTTLKATIGCMAPYDIDDDNTDDSMTKVAGLVDDVASQSYDVAIGLGLGTLLVIGAWFAGIIGSASSVKNRDKREKPNSPKGETPEEKVIPDLEEEDEFTFIDEDDISFEDDEDEPVVVETKEEEMPTQESTKSASASGRLSALRQEMTSDDDSPQEQKPVDDLESRMNKFFADK